MERHYKFNRFDYDENGFNLKNGGFFLDLIWVWEKDFHEEFFPFFSNCLLGNAFTMISIKNCLCVEPHEDIGFDMIDGEIDLDKADKIESHSKRHTIYAISSRINEDDPLMMVRDDDLEDGKVILKWLPEFEDEDDLDGPMIPVGEVKVHHR